MALIAILFGLPYAYLYKNNLGWRDAVDDLFKLSSFDWVFQKELEGEEVNKFFDEARTLAESFHETENKKLEESVMVHRLKSIFSQMREGKIESGKETIPFSSDWKYWEKAPEVMEKIRREVIDYAHSFEGGEVVSKMMSRDRLSPEEKVEWATLSLMANRYLPAEISLAREKAIKEIRNERGLANTVAIGDDTLERKISEMKPVEACFEKMKADSKAISADFFRKIQDSTSLSNFDKEVLARVYLYNLLTEKFMKAFWTRREIMDRFNDTYLRETEIRLRVREVPHAWKNSWRYTCLFIDANKGQPFHSAIVRKHTLLNEKMSNWVNGAGPRIGKKWRDIGERELERMVRGTITEDEFIEKFTFSFMRNTGGNVKDKEAMSNARNWLMLQNEFCRMAMRDILMNIDLKKYREQHPEEDRSSLIREVTDDDVDALSTFFNNKFTSTRKTWADKWKK